MKRTCLIIATWSGKRKWLHPLMKKDRSFYVRTQVQYLSFLNHSLDKIFFVVPKNNDEPKEFTESIEEIDNSSIGSAYVEVVRRQNIGFSYGSYLHVINEVKNLFDYYIFIEDDYVFEIDNFDKILVSFLDKEHGVVVAHIGKGTYPFNHLMVSNGASSFETFANTREKYWKDCFDGSVAGHRIQLRFSKLMMDVTKCRDIGPKYATLYRERNGMVRLFHEGGTLFMRGL